mmetsp:Transcript_44430/g.96592  ORF Transcript_44430/g.96592 Transcript_44430/m.96592 type:complete len:206 (+) Transcript_44430:1627-2244(+)
MVCPHTAHRTGDGDGLLRAAPDEGVVVTMQRVFAAIERRACPCAHAVILPSAVSRLTGMSVVVVALLTAATESRVTGVEGVLIIPQVDAHPVRATILLATLLGVAWKEADHLTIVSLVHDGAMLAQTLRLAFVVNAKTSRPAVVDEALAIVNVLTPRICRPMTVLRADQSYCAITLHAVAVVAMESVCPARLGRTLPGTMRILLC